MFLVCGEALMDVFSLGETSTGTTLDARIGGSPFNVAVALARMAQPVGFFGAVSSGFLGERLMRALGSEGVDTQAVARTAAPTTLSLVELDAQGVPSYAFYGKGGADRQLEASDLQRIGANVRALPSCDHNSKISVLPEPVGACTTTSLPSRKAVTACCCHRSGTVT